MELSLKEIAALCNGSVKGDPGKRISGVNTLDDATGDELVFVTDSRHARKLEGSKAGAVLCRSGDLSEGIDQVHVKDPLLAFAIVAERLNPESRPGSGIANTAVLDSTAKLGPGCIVGDHVVIGENVTIGSNVFIKSGSRIESDCEIGADTVIHQNVVIKQGTRIGTGCRLHPGVILGADGFGLVQENGGWRRIPQLGKLVLGNNVDIGANTTIDRGSLGNTVIGNGVKMDNLIQVGHNVRIGDNTVIAAHTAIAGSTVIGDRCEIGGCVGIMDHSEIGDNVKIGGGSVVSGRITEPGIYSSSIKAEKLVEWQKNAAWVRKLNSIVERLKKLETK